MTDRDGQSAPARVQRAVVAASTLVLLLLGTTLALAGGVWSSTPDPLVAGIRAPLSTAEGHTVVAPPPEAQPFGEPAPAKPGDAAAPRNEGAAQKPSGGGASAPSASNADAQHKDSGQTPQSDDGDDAERDDDEPDDEDDHETVGPEVRDDDEEHDDDVPSDG